MNLDNSSNKIGFLTKKVTVYRFKFTDEVNTAITSFAKIHQFDNRHDYKSVAGGRRESRTR